MTCKDFEERFIPLSGQLFALANGLLGDEDDARDAVQESYLKLWRMADRLAAMEHPEAFAARTVRNECLMTLRRRARHRPEEELPDTAEDDTGPERMERRSLAARLLRGLTAKARRIVVLRHLGEYSNSEVARLTGETEENVRQQLSRARRKMRQMLDNEPNG